MTSGQARKTGVPRAAKRVSAKPRAVTETTGVPRATRGTAAKPRVAKPATAKPDAAKQATAKPRAVAETTGAPRAARGTAAKPRAAEKAAVEPRSVKADTKQKAENIDPECCWVYILRCADGTLYTGWTNDLPARVAAHNAGKGAKYTRGRLPARLVYSERVSGKGEALRREYAVKQMTREEKERLILGNNGKISSET